MEQQNDTTSQHIFYIGRDYIAVQNVQTQNVYLSPVEGSVADSLTDQANDYKRNVVDAEYEPVTDYCPYIDRNVLIEHNLYTPMEFESMLRKACEDEAPVLADFLHKNQKYGYLDFHGDSKKQIYNNLRAYFPNMRQYSYQNFASYFWFHFILFDTDFSPCLIFILFSFD